MIDWHPTHHHFGWYTFDWCSSTGCDDPTHTAPEDGFERQTALLKSEEREADKAAKRRADAEGRKLLMRAALKCARP